MADFEALLFDLDGTLIDTAPDFVTSLNIQLQRHGLPTRPDPELRAGVTNGSVGLIQYAFDITPEDPDFDPLRQEFLSIYFDNLADRTRLFDGMQTVLDSCHAAGIPWGIATNKPWKYTEAVLRALNLLDSAASVICPDHVQQTKPHPESVQMACEQMGVTPQMCVMVGDHRRDIEAGRNAGARTIAAAWGYIDEGENIADWAADLTLDCPAKLHPLLFQN